MSEDRIETRDAQEQWYLEHEYPWMNAKQWECFEMLCDLFGGAHHLCGGPVQPTSPKGIVVNLRNGNFATYDFNNLTRAVIMAHKRCIRFEIAPSGPGMLKLYFHKRNRPTEGDSMWDRHPTLEEVFSGELNAEDAVI